MTHVLKGVGSNPSILDCWLEKTEDGSFKKAHFGELNKLVLIQYMFSVNDRL